MGNPTGKGGPKKGESRNPSGRPKIVRVIQELALEHSEEAYLKIVQLMRNSDDDRIVLAAAEKILDRAYGKAPQTLEHKGDAINPVQFIFSERPLTEAEWEAQYLTH